jgi:uncharacterized repeat protein (TIGR02543 family)
VRIYPEGTSFRVAKDWVGVLLIDAINRIAAGIFPNPLAYYVSSTTKSWVWESAGSFDTIQIPYVTSNDTNKSFYISQALVMGQRFVQDVRGFSINGKVNVLYPFANEPPFCWDIFMALGGDRFNDWEAALHEYGHFIQARQGTNNISLAEYALYNPRHTSVDDHIASEVNDGKGNKSYGMKLAWTEAWATTFSMVVIDHYSVGYYSSGQTLAAAGVLNTTGDILEYSNFPDSYYLYEENMGEGQEDALIALLWNLYKKPFFGQNGFWNTTTISGTYTFTNYANRLHSAYPANRNEIGQLMAHFKIAPQDLTVTNVPNQSTPPSLSWRVNGSQYNPNNQFRIAFYDASSVLKYETGNVSFSLTADPSNSTRCNFDTARYTLSQAEWDSALSQFPTNSTISLLVKGYLSSTPTSGPYWSAYQTIKLSDGLQYSLISNGTAYEITGLGARKSTILLIPGEYNGLPVTRIADYAFANEESIEYVLLYDTLEIGAGVFSGCINLDQVLLCADPTKSPKSIGTNVFANCSGLTGVYMCDYGIYSSTAVGTAYMDAPDWAPYRHLIKVDGYSYVRFNTDGGSAVSPVWLQQGSGYSLPAPVKAGYTFNGWYDNANLIGSPVSRSGTWTGADNVTLYTKWEADAWEEIGTFLQWEWVDWNQNVGYNAEAVFAVPSGIQIDAGGTFRLRSTDGFGFGIYRYQINWRRAALFAPYAGSNIPGDFVVPGILELSLNTPVTVPSVDGYGEMTILLTHENGFLHILFSCGEDVMAVEFSTDVDFEFSPMP